MKKETIALLPKLDLHCHLDGSLTQRCVSELLSRDVSLQELQVDEDCQNLAEYLEKFDTPLLCLQSSKNLKKASYDFLMETAKENTKYIEVRFAPMLSVNDNLSCREVIESVLLGLEAAKKECGVDYNVITCAMRHHSEEMNLSMLKTAREFLGHGVCAADLAGNEAAYPMKGFKTLFEEVRKMEMPFTIHAGECGSVENVVEAVRLGAARIGHGIALGGHKEAIELCKEKRIGIEMCPISNQQTKAVSDILEYPMWAFLDAGLLVTLNTDNRMVSNTSISKEIEFVSEHFLIPDEMIYKMMFNSVDVSFASDAKKQELMKMIKKVQEDN